MEDVTESRPSPLILPEILDKVFGYLRVADLKAARLVNWTWNNVTNRAIKSKCGRMIGFSNVDNEELRLRRYKFHPICDMHKFLKWVDRTKEKTEFPITRILVQITFDPIDAEFLEAVAPFVEELWIQMDARQGLPQSESPLFRHIDYPALKKLRLFYVECPTITTIELRDNSHPSWRRFEISEVPDGFPLPPKLEQKISQMKKKLIYYAHKVDTRGHDRFLATLLCSASTLLESFSVLLDLEDEEHIIPYSTEAIRECFTLTMRGLQFGYKVRALREFETTLPYDNASLMRLSNIKVSTLKIAIHRTTVDSTTFSKFLQSQSEWLKNLTITNECAVYTDRYTDQRQFYVDFPEMTALQSLTLREIKSEVSGQRDRVQYPSISYRKQFPALKQITFLFCEDAAVRKFCRVTDSSDTVTELSVKALDLDIFWGADSSYFSHELFPNLRKLEIGPPTGKVLIHVYENLPLLEHLCIYTSWCGFESSVFGCPSSSCSNDIDKPCTSSWCGRYLNKEGLKLSIWSLSRLKTLRLSSPGKVFLRDVTCRRIMASPSLERLILESGDGKVAVEPIAVSDLMLNEMRTKFQVEILPYDRIMKENKRMRDKWCYD